MRWTRVRGCQFFVEDHALPHRHVRELEPARHVRQHGRDDGDVAPVSDEGVGVRTPSLRGGQNWWPRDSTRAYTVAATADILGR
jgi:hypothetical protein